MVYGLWFMVYGLWFMANGLWNVSPITAARTRPTHPGVSQHRTSLYGIKNIYKVGSPENLHVENLF